MKQQIEKIIEDANTMMSEVFTKATADLTKTTRIDPEMMAYAARSFNMMKDSEKLLLDWAEDYDKQAETIKKMSDKIDKLESSLQESVETNEKILSAINEVVVKIGGFKEVM